MERLSESLRIGGAEVRIVYPLSYKATATRRYPLLLSIGALTAERCEECVALLNIEGVLPEMIVAKVTGLVKEVETFLFALKATLPLLDAPAACWIVGTGHDAVRALEFILECPDLFLAGAFLSTSFEGSEGAPPLYSPMLRTLENLKTLPAETRLYFDYGTLGLDECYELYHRDLGCIFRDKGRRDGIEFQITRSIGGDQSLTSWYERLNPALRWLAMRKH